MKSVPEHGAKDDITNDDVNAKCFSFIKYTDADNIIQDVLPAI